MEGPDFAETAGFSVRSGPTLCDTLPEDKWQECWQFGTGKLTSAIRSDDTYRLLWDEFAIPSFILNFFRIFEL